MNSKLNFTQRNLIFSAVSGLAFLLAPLASSTAIAKDYLVDTQKAYKRAAKSIKPGDTIILRDGEWKDFKIVFEGEGREEAKLSLRAETPGGVTLTGQSNLRMGGAYLHVSGLVFKDGYAPSRDVIDMRSPKYKGAILSELSEITIDGFNKPGTDEKDYWIDFRGIGNRLTKSALLNKTSLGSTVIVTQSLESDMPGQHIISGNYFGPRPPLGKNGGETIRVGVGKVAHQRFETKIYRNYFDRCNGEAEIISIKSGGNFIGENMFVETGGAVTFRQGDDNFVVRNIFLGGNSKVAGGVRLTSFNQTVRDNYFEGLGGKGGRAALTFMNGLSDKLPVLYRQVQNAQIYNNSFVDVKTLSFGVATNRDGDLPPINSMVTRNLFLTSGTVDEADKVSISAHTDMSGVSFSENAGNVAGLDAINIPQNNKIELRRSETNGLFYIENDDTLSKLGAPKNLKPFSRDAVGPSYFTPAAR